MRLESCNAELLNKLLSLFLMEVRKVDGTRYPPASIHLLLCGLQRYMRRTSDSLVNICDKNDVRFQGPQWWNGPLLPAAQALSSSAMMPLGNTFWVCVRGPQWWNGPL